MHVSARTGEGIDEVREWLVALHDPGGRAGVTPRGGGPPHRPRTEANRAFFAAEADRIARLCHQMSERFARGGRLLAVGRSPAARSDARHVAVEFVHPVIVGKRALPAVAFERGRRARRCWPARTTW